MRKDRLLKLAAYLETVPRGKFDMDTWVADDIKTVKQSRECGFSGCAIGWATHGKLFRGLHFQFEPELNEIWPFYRGKDGFEGVALLFGITFEDAMDKLFGSNLKGTPKQVATRIRKFVKERSE